MRSALQAQPIFDAALAIVFLFTLKIRSAVLLAAFVQMKLDVSRLEENLAQQMLSVCLLQVLLGVAGQ